MVQWLGYTPEQWRGLNYGRCKRFHLLPYGQNGSDVHRASNWMGTTVFFPRNKKADHSTQTTVMLENAWSHNSAPLRVFVTSAVATLPLSYVSMYQFNSNWIHPCKQNYIVLRETLTYSSYVLEGSNTTAAITLTFLIIIHENFAVTVTAKKLNHFISSHFSSFSEPLLFMIYDMECLSTATGLTPGGSSILHNYTQTIHRTTQWNRAPRREHNNNNNNNGSMGMGEVVPL